MKTLRVPMSWLCPLPCVLVLAACAADGGEPSSTPPSSPVASTHAAASSPVVAAEPIAAAEPIEPAEPKPTEPEPEPEPRPPNAEPASLQLAFHGRCNSIDVSIVDGQSFVHYRSPTKDHLLRLDERGAVAETMPFDIPRDHHTSIDRVLGRWPDQLLLLTETNARDDVYRALYRLADGSWTQVKTLGDDASYDGAWPWIDGSILALARHGFDDHARTRLAVVRGPGKGPSLAKLQRASKCDSTELHVSDVAVLPDGTVMALAMCDDSWLATWRPGQSEGSVTRVPSESYFHARLSLDEQGHGFIVGESDAVRVADGKATPVQLPKGRGDARVDGRRGLAWVIRGDTLWRSTEGGWDVVPTPDDRRLDAAAGLELGTPWLLFANGTVAMQTADGTWHDATLPAAPELGRAPKAVRLAVHGPGDAWVTAKYVQPREGSKRGGTRLRALYTSRPEPAARQCGQDGA